MAKTKIKGKPKITKDMKKFDKKDTTKKTKPAKKACLKVWKMMTKTRVALENIKIISY